jgi:hypothetical protein
MDESTTTRDPAAQICPVLRVMLRAIERRVAQHHLRRLAPELEM